MVEPHCVHETEGIPPTTPAWLQSTARERAMIPVQNCCPWAYPLEHSNMIDSRIKVPSLSMVIFSADCVLAGSLRTNRDRTQDTNVPPPSIEKAQALENHSRQFICPRGLPRIVRAHRYAKDPRQHLGKTRQRVAVFNTKEDLVPISQ